MDLVLRPIQPKDNIQLAKIIREVLTQFGANKPGTVFTDPTTDALYELFQTPKSHYLVAELEGKLVGGCGIFPTHGLPNGCTEIVKLYLSDIARGKGIGKRLIQEVFLLAKKENYSEVYLETLPELHVAVGLYEHMGFNYLDQPYGESGHFACDLWMSKIL